MIDDVAFRKMHGLGNDFVVVDARMRTLELTDKVVRALANRHTGVGFDALLVIKPAYAGGDAFMTVHNADGSLSSACGNGARCVAALLMEENQRDSVVIETMAGLNKATRTQNGDVSIDMGPARLDWQDIPLTKETDTLHLGISEGPLIDPVAVSIGNPHTIFFVEDVEVVDLANYGPLLEKHSLFPEHTNVEVVQVLGQDHLRMRVWERGSGITQACGTGACAATVAAVRRNLSDRHVTVTLDGGDLLIKWRDDGHVVMTGPVVESFYGTINGNLLL